MEDQKKPEPKPAKDPILVMASMKSAPQKELRMERIG
jgi:hypothetical protein